MTDDMRLPEIDLSPHDWEEINGILKRCVPQYAVWAFGSRVDGTAKAYSDLDLAIITDHPLSLEEMADLKEAFDESDLTIKVDIVDWASISDNFREIIASKYVVIQKTA